jgi:uncharacterized membrane-anchored protein
MLARALLIALSAGAAIADGYGSHGGAFALVLCAVVAGAGQALAGYWELARADGGYDPDPVARLQAILSALAVVLLVLSAAVRSPALLDSGVPALGASALAGALAIQALQWAVFAGAELHRRTRRARTGIPLPR